MGAPAGSKSAGRLLMWGVLLAFGAVLLLPLFYSLRHYLDTRKCRNTLRSLGYAGWMYADENGRMFPSRLVELKTIVGDPRLLVCPSDPSRRPAVAWSEIEPANVTYEVVTPGLAVTNSSAPFLRCPIHNLVVFADGHVERVQ